MIESPLAPTGKGDLGDRGLRAYAGRRVYIHNYMNKSILNI